MDKSQLIIRLHQENSKGKDRTESTKSILNCEIVQEYLQLVLDRVGNVDSNGGDGDCSCVIPQHNKFFIRRTGRFLVCLVSAE